MEEGTGSWGLPFLHDGPTPSRDTRVREVWYDRDVGGRGLPGNWEEGRYTSRSKLTPGPV